MVREEVFVFCNSFWWH